MNPFESPEDRKLLEPLPLFHPLYKRLPPLPQEEKRVLVNRELPPLPQEDEGMLVIHVISPLPQEEERVLNLSSRSCVQSTQAPGRRWTRWLQRLQLSRMRESRPDVLRSDSASASAGWSGRV